MNNTYFAIATAGSTVDGRSISDKQIRDMAKHYDPEIYAARIWLEHIRGYLPDSPFRSYGDVLALKTGKNKNGDLQLLAQLKALPDLVKLNQEGQKVFTSIELDPDFQGKGFAYLVGLAITDSPASTGTDRLQFSQRNAHLFSTPQELTAMSENLPDTKEDSKTLFAKFSNMFAKKEELEEVKEATPTTEDLSATMALFADELLNRDKEHQAALGAAQQAFDSKWQELDSKLAKIEAEFSSMSAKFNAQEQESRPAATGNNAQFLTDY